MARAGKGDIVINNNKGVILHLKAGEKGLALDPVIEGLMITLACSPYRDRALRSYRL